MTRLASASGKIAAALFALFLVAMNLPVVTAVDTTTLVFGTAPLYLWFVVWGVFGSLVLVWAAHRSAFGLSDDQVPPEFGSAEEMIPDRNVSRDDPDRG